MRFATAILGIVALAGCGAPPRLTVAAASNLTEVFDEIGRAFTQETGIEVVFTYGSTAALAQQVEAGAPVDVFAAADTDHVAHLVLSRKLVHHAVYGRGQLALWSPHAGIKALKDLWRPEVKFVAIAQPELAPYGEAAVQTLRSSGLWDTVQPKLVYAGSVSQAKQLAATGNADATLTAYSLVFRQPGSILLIDPALHAPIDQALGVVAASTRPDEARKFTAFVLGPKGRAILIQNGYL